MLMVFIRDLDPDEHVYANPVSSFLQQVGKASGRFMSKLVKKIKHKVRARQARKKDRPPSFVQLPPRPCGGRTLSPELCGYHSPPAAVTRTRQGTRKPKSTNIYRHLEGNKSYESMSQINPLSWLYVTNPDVPTPRTAVDNLSISSSVSTTSSKWHITAPIFTRPPSFKRSFRPIRRRRSRRPLEDIPEERISAESGNAHLPLSMEFIPSQIVHDIDELWFTTSSPDTSGSPSVCSSAYPSQDPVFTPSASLPSSQAACPQPQREIAPTDSHSRIVTPIRTLRSSRGRRLSVPPRIPSLYFRAGSPFADRNLPWNRLSRPEENVP